MIARKLLGMTLCFGLAILGPTGCGESARTNANNNDLASDSPAGSDPSGTTDSDPNHCPRLPKAADRDRYVVISHPYDASANASSAYEVLRLSTTGHLTRSDTTFDLNRMV
jgi:hypothetical protein